MTIATEVRMTPSLLVDRQGSYRVPNSLSREVGLDRSRSRVSRAVRARPVLDSGNFLA